MWTLDLYLSSLPPPSHLTKPEPTFDLRQPTQFNSLFNSLDQSFWPHLLSGVNQSSTFRHLPGSVAARTPPRVRRPHERPLRHCLPLPRPAWKHARLRNLAQPDPGGQRVRHWVPPRFGQQHASKKRDGGGSRNEHGRRPSRRDQGRIRPQDQEH